MYLKISTLMVILGVFCCGLLQVNQTTLASVGKAEMSKVIGQGCTSCYNICSGGRCDGKCSADDDDETCGSAKASGQEILWACIDFGNQDDRCQTSGESKSCSAFRCYCASGKCTEETKQGGVSGNKECSD